MSCKKTEEGFLACFFFFYTEEKVGVIKNIKRNLWEKLFGRNSDRFYWRIRNQTDNSSPLILLSLFWLWAMLAVAVITEALTAQQ